MQIDYKQFGKRIATRRKEMNMKQYELAEKADISNKYLSNIERGASIPSLCVFVTLCYCLNTTPDNLLLGVAKSDNIPLIITENLKLCNEESLKMIEEYVQFILKNQDKRQK